MDQWMDGWTEEPINKKQLDHSSGHHQRAAPHNQITPPLVELPDVRSLVPTPAKWLRQEGRPQGRCNTHTASGYPWSSSGQEEATGASLAHTQHAYAQHEGVHSIGHDSRPPPGRACGGHHLFWLSFLTFHLQQDVMVIPSYRLKATHPPCFLAGLFIVNFIVIIYGAITMC